MAFLNNLQNIWTYYRYFNFTLPYIHFLAIEISYFYILELLQLSFSISKACSNQLHI